MRGISVPKLFLLLSGLIACSVRIEAQNPGSSYQLNCLTNERYITVNKRPDGNIISNNARMSTQAQDAWNPYYLGWSICAQAKPDDPWSGVSNLLEHPIKIY